MRGVLLPRINSSLQCQALSIRTMTMRMYVETHRLAVGLLREAPQTRVRTVDVMVHARTLSSYPHCFHTGDEGEEVKVYVKTLRQVDSDEEFFVDYGGGYLLQRCQCHIHRSNTL